MSADVHASRFLRRRVAGEDREEDDAFWAAAPRLYDFSQQNKPPPLPSPASAAPAPSSSPCLLTLQRCGVGWGVRRRVRYVGQHRARQAQNPPPIQRSVVVQGDDESSTNNKRRKRPEEAAEAEESSEDERKVVRTEKSKSGRGHGSPGTKRPKKIRQEEERKQTAPKVEVAEATAPRAMVDRWTANRYATAEASLLGILRSRGARAGKPVPRGELRVEARRHIGDTGLLDHLLKHMADKVPAGSAERFRRRHNADGAMEYWLEPAELAAVRRKAGVADPYWVPPPGWKSGDPVSPDACALVVKRQVEELATELAVVKRHMELLSSSVMQMSKKMKPEAEKAYISWQDKYDCMMKANGNLENLVLSLEEKYEHVAQANGELEEEVLFLKEKYENVLEKNTRLEKQMAALSCSFLSLKEDLFLLNTGDQLMMEPEQADLFVKETWKADKQEDNAGRAPDDADQCAGNQPVDATAVDGDGTSSGGGTDVQASGGKKTSRKCSVRICKPEGTFQWPDMALLPPVLAPSSPLTPMAEAVIADADAVANLAFMDELHEYMMAGGLPTPPSASSTNAAAAKLPLLSTPASPVQPPPPPSTTSARDVLQAVQPYSRALGLQLRHTDTSSSSSAPCGASLLEGKKAILNAGAGGGNVGTELALATPSCWSSNADEF